MNQEDPLWIKSPDILLRLGEFVPTSDMTMNQKLNAVTRFLVYAGILLSLIFNSPTPLYIPMIGGVLVYLAHEHYPGIQRGGAVLPSRDNPFMNVLLTDDVFREAAANVEDPKIKASMDAHFSEGLHKDINNVWDHNNSQRQFFTTPATTTPNDRDAFMKWCWDTPYTCKEGNTSRCLKYEDVRGKGGLFSA